jgi:DGQHR domain-containing protein
MSNRPPSISRRALQIRQVDDAPLYLFTLTAAEVLQVADISRVSRDQQGNLIGYQRAEVKQHVQQIIDYLNSPRPLFPNAIILAFRPVVKFSSIRGPNAFDGLASAGTLEIPLPDNDAPRPAWIVDGQQRALALAQAENHDLPVPISAFIAETVDLQRDQFVRVNSAKPLSPRLITELLPEISSPISPRLAARQLPSALVDALNRDSNSPFQGLIKRASTSPEEGRHAVVTDTSLINAIEESLRTGCLATYRNLAGHYDNEAVWAVLLCYWSAVKDAFPDAWGKPPTHSRLMHGVGIRAMGHLMDRMMGSLNIADKETPNVVRAKLHQIAPLCRWTSGRWEGLDMRWDDVQNVPRHIQQLTQYLIRIYVLGPGAR